MYEKTENDNIHVSYSKVWNDRKLAPQLCSLSRPIAKSINKRKQTYGQASKLARPDSMKSKNCYIAKPHMKIVSRTKLAKFASTTTTVMKHHPHGRQEASSKGSNVKNNNEKDD